MSKAVKIEVKGISRILVLIGGILLIVFGLFSVLGGSFDSRYLGISLSGSIFGIAVGVIALYGHTRVGELVWAVILLVLGYFAGGLGGLLVLLGSLIALIMRFV
jgi:hypothetical protein